MSAQGVDELLRAAQRQAAQQDQAKQMLEMSLRTALQQPHKITRHNLHMAAIGVENGAKVLMFGLPTGDRLEIVVSAGMARELAEGLMAQEPQEKAA